MSDPSKKGTSPGRARPESSRPRSFQNGHQKVGGRKPGTPNFFSADYKKTILEAAYRVGEDGNGKDGLVGYFTWVALYHPAAFALLLSSLLAFDDLESDVEDPSRRTEEINSWVRDETGINAESATTGPGFFCNSLIQQAVNRPRDFAKLFVAAFLRPPAKRRRTTTQPV